MFDIDFLNKEIKKNKILNKIIFFKNIYSTNSFLKEKSFSSGTITLSEIQLAGRGKFGKKWISEKGGLWFSFLINKKEKRPFIFVVLSSVAIIDVLKKYGVKAKIKWPNDVLIDNKKICGILIENDYYRKKIITGIGININNKPPENTDIKAISLRQILNKKIDISKFFIELIKKIDCYIFNLKKLKEVIIKKWIKNQVDLKGKEIKLLNAGKMKNYKVIKVDKSGQIVVSDAMAKIKKIKGEVFFYLK